MKYSPFRHIDSILWKKAPIHLTFFLTRRCDSRCRFCFYLSEDVEPEYDQRELNSTEIEKVAGSMGNLMWLALSGGEIFLRKDLVQIVRIFYDKNKPALILLPTNGLRTEIICAQTEEILKSCPKSTIVVKLSVDGPEDIHDAIRGVPGGYRKTLATYEKLGGLIEKYPNFELGINTVFCSENQDVMDEVIASVAKLEQVKTHTISLIRGKVPDESLKKVDQDKYWHAIDILEENLKKKQSAIYRFRGAKLKAAQDIVQRRLIHQTNQEKKQLIPCYAGRLNLVLSETGDLFPCESFTMKFGNIRNSKYDVTKLLESERAEKILQTIKNKGCYCTHECYFMTNILFNPAMYPALLKEYLQI